MMMAYDRTPSPTPIDDETIAAVRDALLRYVEDGGSTHLVQHALQRLADEGRAKHVHPEQLLVLLKEIWRSIAEVRHAHSTASRDALLARLITICIDAYYRE